MKPELLSPAGSYDAAVAAFLYGADAVYLGLPDFSARAEATNLSVNELALLRAYADTFNPAKKIYITLNTLLHDDELSEAFRVLALLEEIQPDGVIVQDLGVAGMILSHFPSLSLHASTQMAAHSIDSVCELRDMGFRRVVLARELSLDEIRRIVDGSDVEIEVFIHGALCYSFSGLCLFSAMTSGRSGNRGRCAYCCRRPFSAVTAEPAAHPFSMKDISLLPILDKVIATGAHSLKIEGRMKSPLYVACVTNAYRRKLDGALSRRDEEAVSEEIRTIFSRPWTSLYAESTERSTASLIDAETVGHRGALIGTATSVFREGGAKWLRFITARALNRFDGIQVDLTGSSRPFGFSIRNMRRHAEKRESAQIPAGTEVEIQINDENPPHIPVGAPVYCASSQEVQQKYRYALPRPADLKAGIPLDISATLERSGLRLQASSPVTGDDAEVCIEVDAQEAVNSAQTAEAVRKACSRLGDTGWRANSIKLTDPHHLYAPPALLNRARRELIEKIDSKRKQRLAERLRQYEESLSMPGGSPSGESGDIPQYTLKLHVSSVPPLPEGASVCRRLVIEIDDREPRQLLEDFERLKSAFPDAKSILAALPLITRAEQHRAIRANAEHLLHQGIVLWETPGLGGKRMLNELGVDPVSADWTLYVFNREAALMLHRMGFESFVTSPELAAERIFSPGRGVCEPEMLIFQHTPLYISATPPLTGKGEHGSTTETLRDERGTRFKIQKRNHEWITTAEEPLDRTGLIAAAMKRGIRRFRIDRSWRSPA